MMQRMKTLSVLKLTFLVLLPQVKPDKNDDNSDSTKQLDQLLIPSLFPHVPPYIRFSSSEIKDVHYHIPYTDEIRNETEIPYGFTIPSELKPFLQFSKVGARSKEKTFLLQFILNHTGLLTLENGFEFKQKLPKPILRTPAFASWTAMQYTSIRTMHRNPIITRNYQKYDHLPGLSLGSKIKQCLTYREFMKKYGKNESDFELPCYVIPDELPIFKQYWDQKIGETTRQLWLLKPPTTSKGSGIRLFNHYNELSNSKRRRSVLAQQYLPSSYGERKLEIRTYALVTSSDPLRIYISYDCITVFSLQNFTTDPNTARDACQHIVNRESCYLGKFNFDFDPDTFIQHTSKYLQEAFNPDQEKQIKLQIEAITVKSLLSIRDRMETTYKKYLFNRYNAFHLVSFDFFVSDTLHVWLNEVNSGPDLKMIHTTQLLAEGSTIAGYHLPPTMGKKPRQLVWNYLNGLKTSRDQLDLDEVVFNKKLYEFNRGEHHREVPRNNSYLKTMLDNLTPDDVRQLIIAEDELNRVSTRFVRIFPTVRMTDEYMKYIDLEAEDSYYYKLYAAWENKYGRNGTKSRKAGIMRLKKLASRKFHLL